MVFVPFLRLSRSDSVLYLAPVDLKKVEPIELKTYVGYNAGRVDRFRAGLRRGVIWVTAGSGLLPRRFRVEERMGKLMPAQIL
jgi:hypothetical protein